MTLASMVKIQTMDKTYKRCGLGIEVNDGCICTVVNDEKESEED